VALFEAMAGAGADGFEVGIPYSDPLMDGPIIQQGSERALAAGTTLDVAVGLLGQVVASTGLPSLAMTYANPVFRRGVDTFCGALAEAGADGIIVPDLPVNEAGPVLKSGGAARSRARSCSSLPLPTMPGSGRSPPPIRSSSMPWPRWG
jgi:tryptophan synthase alpha chain